MDTTKIELSAEWIGDCQGKKDYDGEICVISSRYYPRGGGFSILDNSGVHTNEDQTIKPSACSTIGIRLPDTYIFQLARFECEGETFEEVKEKVESWAKIQFERVVNALRKEFGVD